MKKIVIVLSALISILTCVHVTYAENSSTLYTVSRTPGALRGSELNVKIDDPAWIDFSVMSGNVSPGTVKVSDDSLAQDYFTVNVREFEVTTYKPALLIVSCRKRGEGHPLKILNSAGAVISDITNVSCTLPPAPSMLDGWDDGLIKFSRNYAHENSRADITDMVQKASLAIDSLPSGISEKSDPNTWAGTDLDFYAYDKAGKPMASGTQYTVKVQPPENGGSIDFLKASATAVDAKGKVRVTFLCDPLQNTHTKVDILGVQGKPVYKFSNVACNETQDLVENEE